MRMSRTDHSHLPLPPSQDGAAAVLPLEQAARRNRDYRRVILTGNQMQATLMCIPPRESIGLEMHAKADQLLYIVEGHGMVRMGQDRCTDPLNEQAVYPGAAIFVPAATWHNLYNTGARPLRLFSLYAPPQHPHGSVAPSKHEEPAADREE